MVYRANKNTGDEGPRFGLRLPSELRETLEKLAEKNGRSLNAEIVAILGGAAGGGSSTVVPFKAEQPRGRYLNEHDEMLLRIFHKMPVEKQLALLSLFK